MTLRGTRASAFGVLNKPLHVVTKELHMALKKAEAECLKLAGPTTRAFPMDRLRRQFANAMALEVIFSPKMTVVKNDKWPNSRLSKIDISPVWKTAPRSAFNKTNKFCSLLHTIVCDGYKANIVHDLVRLSIEIWNMSMRSFNGLCHRILSRIYKATEVARSKPDPVQRFGTLSTNPVCNPYCVYRYPDRGEHKRSLFGVTHLPKTLGLHCLMRRVLKLGALSARLLTQHGRSPVRGFDTSRTTMR